MQTVYIGNTLINDVMLGSQRMDDVLRYGPSTNYVKDGANVIYDAALVSLADSTWPDQSGNNQTATLNGLSYAQWNPGNFGYFTFPTDNTKYVSRTNIEPLRFAFDGDFTIDVWLTIAALTNTAGLDICAIFAKEWSQDDPGLGMFIDRPNSSNKGQIRFYFNSTSATLLPTKANFTAGTWFNLQITRSGSTIQGYFNQSSLGTVTKAGDYSNDKTLQIGRGFTSANSNYPLDGKLGFFAIYDKVLSAAELAQNYNTLSARYV